MNRVTKLIVYYNYIFKKKKKSHRNISATNLKWCTSVSHNTQISIKQNQNIIITGNTATAHNERDTSHSNGTEVIDSQ